MRRARSLVPFPRHGETGAAGLPLSATVLVASTAGVLRVTISREEQRNALSRAILDELGRIFAAHAADEALRVAVLTAAGSTSFAAGGDLRDRAGVRTREEAVLMAARARAALDAGKHRHLYRKVALLSYFVFRVGANRPRQKEGRHN